MYYIRNLGAINIKLLYSNFLKNWFMVLKCIFYQNLLINTILLEFWVYLWVKIAVFAKNQQCEILTKSLGKSSNLSKPAEHLLKSSLCGSSNKKFIEILKNDFWPISKVSKVKITLFAIFVI